jgi:hypothetical protein
MIWMHPDQKLNPRAEDMEDDQIPPLFGKKLNVPILFSGPFL